MKHNLSNSKLFFFICTVLFCSCASVKDIAYLQKTNISTFIKSENTNSVLYEVRIKPKDILSISIVSSEPEASKHYNLTVPQIAEANLATNLFSQPLLQSYLVDNDGNINFPVFGRLKISGLTSKELEALLQNKLESAFSKEPPIITIRFINFSISILGEVLKPGKYEAANERLTVLEALALAGDLTIYGNRKSVKILREMADGTKVFIPINLNDENIINSAGYYLEQNDVVYVSPNNAKSRTSSIGAAENLGISALSILISMASLVVTILK